MRYEKIEKCLMCNGEGSVFRATAPGGRGVCNKCHGTGEISTRVTRAEILEDFGAVGKWAVYGINSGDLQFVSNYEEHPKEGYTCEQIHVIRRNHE